MSIDIQHGPILAWYQILEMTFKVRMYVIRTVFTGEAYWRIDYCQILRRSFFSIFSWQYNDLFQFFFMPGTKTVDRRWMFEGQSCSCLEMVIRVFILSNHHIFWRKWWSFPKQITIFFKFDFLWSLGLTEVRLWSCSYSWCLLLVTASVSFSSLTAR